MPAFRQGDVVKVPFPHPDLEEIHQFLWVVMITSAENRGYRIVLYWRHGDAWLADRSCAGQGGWMG
jgi:hypothetical protein